MILIKCHSVGVTAYSLHPGVVASNLQKSDPSVMGKVVRVLMKLSSTTALQTSYNSLFVATSSAVPKQGQGKFHMPVGKLDPRADRWLEDTKLNAELWEQSEEKSKQL